MSDEDVVEVNVEAEEVHEEGVPGSAPEAGEMPADQAKPKKDKGSYHIKEALKQVESFGQALSEALQGRGNVVMVRVNDEALEHLDMLVDAEITKSRSESAAFLINEGIKTNEALFGKIRAITEQIAELREQLRQDVKLEPAPEEED